MTWHDELLQQQESSDNVAAEATDTVTVTATAGASRVLLSLIRDAPSLIHRALKINLSTTGAGTVERGLVGDAASLLSAILYGYYTVVLRMNVSEGGGGGDEPSTATATAAGAADIGAAGGEEESFTCETHKGSEHDRDLRYHSPLHGSVASSSRGGGGSSSSSSSDFSINMAIPTSHIDSDGDTETVGQVGVDVALVAPPATPPEIPLSLVLGYVGLLVTVCGLPVLGVCSAYCLESLCRYVNICVSRVKGE